MRDKFKSEHINQSDATCLIFGPGDHVDNFELKLISLELDARWSPRAHGYLISG